MFPFQFSLTNISKYIKEHETNLPKSNNTINNRMTKDTENYKNILTPNMKEMEKRAVQYKSTLAS